ncbi:TonB-dependent receptor [Sphingobacterium lactis]|uniref:Iron complex outermembrane recepter protein n=1 Tax=Sphingobacterium lactis TaxID=797291 RepID=A0A1H5UCV6_9SPHI|nr:TonB-dependent receptor [Sphingobacterium lactis]SEF72131.1 iron complex outermembrane recepter protein [Sphingobacterium lactis]
MLKYIWALALVILMANSQAQSTSAPYIKGIVLDEEQKPIFGASITVVGSKSSTVSDSQGHFRIHKDDGHEHMVLRVSALGYETFEYPIHAHDGELLKVTLRTYAEKIEAVAVQGTREEQKSAIRSSLSKETIEASKGKLAAEVFANLSGVSLLNTGHSVAKPVIHGLHSNRVLLLNHGVKQEGQQWGMEHAPEMDPFTADEFEVIKGAQAVRYGADALGGVLIARSENIDPNAFKGRADLIGQSNGRGGTANLQFSGGINRIPQLAWKAQVSGKKLGDIRTADYNLGNTGVQELNFSGQLQYRRNNSFMEAYYSRFATELGVFYGAHIGSVEDIYARIEHGEPFEKYDFSYAINAPKQRVDHQLGKLKYQQQFDSGLALEAQYAWQQNHRKEFDMRRAVSDDVPMSDMVLTSQALDLILRYKNHSVGLNAGTQVNNNVTGTGTTPIIPNFDSYNLGLFGIHQFQWNTLTLEAGWRYDFKYFDAAGYRYRFNKEEDVPEQYLLEDTRQFHNFSGSLGVVYPISEKWQYKSSIGLAWRAPTANELYSDGVHHAAAIYEIGNLDLKAEQGVKWVNSISHRAETWSLTADVYGQLIHNYIYAAPNPDSIRQTIRGTFPVFSYAQVNALFYGADLQFDWKVIPSIKYSLQASLVRAKDQSADTYLPYIPSDRLQHAIQWYFGKTDAAYLKFGHEFVAEQKRFEAGTDYTSPPPAYHLFNAFITQPLAVGKQQLHISLAVENLFNTSYKDYMDRFHYYAHRPGRNFILSLNFKF